MKLDGIKGAIFDMDGTLIDSLGVWHIIWEQFGMLGGISNFCPTEEDDRAVRTMLLPDAMALIHRNYGLGKNAFVLTQHAEQLLRTFYRETVRLKAGVLEFLQYLSANGVKMCIASATDPVLLQLVKDRLGLNRFFDFTVSCAEVGKGKDQPDVFLAAVSRFNFAPSEIWVFEDSLTAIRTAKAIGMKTVGIFDQNNYGQQEIEKTADYYISNEKTLEVFLSDV